MWTFFLWHWKNYFPMNNHSSHNTKINSPFNRMTSWAFSFNPPPFTSIEYHSWSLICTGFNLISCTITSALVFVEILTGCLKLSSLLLFLDKQIHISHYPGVTKQQNHPWRWLGYEYLALQWTRSGDTLLYTRHEPRVRKGKRNVDAAGWLLLCCLIYYESGPWMNFFIVAAPRVYVLRVRCKW